MLPKRNYFILIAGIYIIFSCSFRSQKELIKTNRSSSGAKGIVNFSYTLLDTPLPGEISQDLLQDLSQIEPKYVQFSIEEEDGSIVFNRKKMELERIAGSDPVSYRPIETFTMKMGEYRVTEFLIQNKNNTVILASPLKGSEKAETFGNSLPRPFSHKTETLLPMPVAMALPGEEEKFGYGAGFVLDEAVSLTIEILDQDSAPVEEVKLQVETKMHEVILTTTLKKGEQTISIPSSSEKFILSFTKDGYEDLKKDVDLQTLEQLGGNPFLQVTLVEKVADKPDLEPDPKPDPEPEPDPKPDPKPTGETIDGFKLYLSNCQSCHKKIGTTKKRGATVARIKAGFNLAQMSSLKGKFNDDELVAIEQALATEIDVFIYPGKAKNGGHIWSSHGLSGIAPGTTVNFINKDPNGPNHMIHVNGPMHQDDDLKPGDTYTVDFPVDANTKFWCHHHENADHAQSVSNTGK